MLTLVPRGTIGGGPNAAGRADFMRAAEMDPGAAFYTTWRNVVRRSGSVGTAPGRSLDPPKAPPTTGGGGEAEVVPGGLRYNFKCFVSKNRDSGIFSTKVSSTNMVVCGQQLGTTNKAPPRPPPRVADAPPFPSRSPLALVGLALLPRLGPRAFSPPRPSHPARAGIPKLILLSNLRCLRLFNLV